MLASGIAKRGMTQEQGLKHLGDQVPLGRVARPAEIAKAVVFLASDASSTADGRHAWRSTAAIRRRDPVCLELQIGHDWKVIRADLVADGVVGNRDRSADEGCDRS